MLQLFVHYKNDLIKDCWDLLEEIHSESLVRKIDLNSKIPSLIDTSQGIVPVDFLVVSLF